MHAIHHFARILPIVGETLRLRRVAVAGLSDATDLVELLAASGIGRWLWLADDRADRLVHRLSAQHGAALNLDARVCALEPWWAALHREHPEMLIGAGTPADLHLALESAWMLQRPALLVRRVAPGEPINACVWLPGDHPAAAEAWVAATPATTCFQADVAFLPAPLSPLPRVGAGEAAPAAGVRARSLAYRTCSLEACSGTYEACDWNWCTAAPLIAGLARAILLRGTSYQRDDLEALLVEGRRAIIIGANHPFDVAWVPIVDAVRVAPELPTFCTPRRPRGTLLIAGLGSLGSVAAMQLVPFAGRFVLADPDRVDTTNHVRQAYPLAAVGKPKAVALAEQMLAIGGRDAVALERALTDESDVADLIAQHEITAALVATGTSADFAIARALRAQNIPHVVGRCYPRARFWEAIIVDEQAGAAFEAIRGRTVPGPVPRPTPEQLAAYSDAGALEAEPATLIESGWAATWMARITAQLLVPSGLRERWLLTLLDAQQTCWVGGAEVQHTDDGPAYGITLPGAIRAFAPQNVRH